MADDKKKLVFFSTFTAGTVPVTGAALATLEKGKLKLLSEYSSSSYNTEGVDPIPVKDIVSFEKINPTTGGASTVEFAMLGISPEANKSYKIRVHRSGIVKNTKGDAFKEETSLGARVYTITTGAAVLIHSDFLDLIIERVNSDVEGFVTASRTALDLKFTQKDKNEGTISVELWDSSYPRTAYAGSKALGYRDNILELTKNLIPLPDNDDHYTTYKIKYRGANANYGVNGNVSDSIHSLTVICQNNVSNVGTFTAALDSILGGTWTPASDFMGLGI